eukprot:scaffold7059_cov250-Pinguiococcus_pyrenoidosus.AAC.1
MVIWRRRKDHLALTDVGAHVTYLRIQGAADHHDENARGVQFGHRRGKDYGSDDDEGRLEHRPSSDNETARGSSEAQHP